MSSVDWSSLVVVADVGEDAAFGRLVDEAGVAVVEKGDHGAGGFVDDLADHLERVFGALAEGDKRDVGMFLAGGGADLLDIDAGGDDDVAQSCQDVGDHAKSFLFLVGNQDVQALVVRVAVHVPVREVGYRLRRDYRRSDRESRFVSAWRSWSGRPASALGYEPRGRSR